jgi:hypothetical protein
MTDPIRATAGVFVLKTTSPSLNLIAWPLKAAEAGRFRRSESTNQARRPLRSDVKLPISVQRSLLDSLFAQEQVQGCDDNVGVLAKLFR